MGLWPQAIAWSSSFAVKWECVMRKHEQAWQRLGGQGRFSEAASTHVLCHRPVAALVHDLGPACPHTPAWCLVQCLTVGAHYP